MRQFNDGSFLKIDLGGEARVTAFRAFRMPTQPWNTWLQSPCHSGKALIPNAFHLPFVTDGMGAGYGANVPRLHLAEQNEGSCTPSLGCSSAHWQVTQASVGVWMLMRGVSGSPTPPPLPDGPRHSDVHLSKNWDKNHSPKIDFLHIQFDFCGWCYME